MKENTLATQALLCSQRASQVVLPASPAPATRRGLETVETGNLSRQRVCPGIRVSGSLQLLFLSTYSA